RNFSSVVRRSPATLNRVASENPSVRSSVEGHLPGRRWLVGRCPQPGPAPPGTSVPRTGSSTSPILQGQRHFLYANDQGRLITGESLRLVVRFIFGPSVSRRSCSVGPRPGACRSLICPSGGEGVAGADGAQPG